MGPPLSQFLHLSATISSHPFTDQLSLTTIAPPLAWYEYGKEDPKLVLLRLNAEWAEIWLDGSSIIAGVKMLLGVDPKRDYKKNVADVPLN
jgi:general stress protein 26